MGTQLQQGARISHIPPPPAPPAPYATPAQHLRHLDFPSAYSSSDAPLPTTTVLHKPSPIPMRIVQQNIEFQRAKAQRWESNAQQQQATHSSTVLAEEIGPYIPTFFTPWEAIQPSMPTYTLEHIKRYHGRGGSEAAEVVSLGGTAYVRLHGYKGAFSMVPLCLETNARFEQWRPPIFDEAGGLTSRLLRELCQVLGPARPSSALPSLLLSELLARLSSEARDLLLKPFGKSSANSVTQCPEGILFISQLQNIFQFTVLPNSNVPEPATLFRVRRAVQGVAPLLVEKTSPTPIVVNEVIRLLRGYPVVTIARLQEILDPQLVKEVRCIFAEHDYLTGEDSVVEGASASASSSSLVKANDDDEDTYACFHRLGEWHAHPTVFGLREVNPVTGEATPCFLSKEEVKRRHKEAMSIAERLAEAKSAITPNRQEIRRLERKLFQQAKESGSSPDGYPILNSTQLADEVVKFLPMNRHIAVHELMKVLPEGLRLQFPKKVIDFFSKNRRHFAVFEMQEPGRYYVIHPSLPLPSGVLKFSYSDMEIVMLCCRGLYNLPSKTMNISHVQMKLPRGARDHIKNAHGDFIKFATKFPKYFVISIARPDEVGANEASSKVTAIAVPTRADMEPV